MSKIPVFTGYVTAGDGDLKYLTEICLALIEGGVGQIEIGVPFSDPIADGPIIQEAMQRALSSGAIPEDALTLARAIRKHSDIPLILFSYLNPILAGGSRFLNEAKKAGFDKLLIVDLPIDEANILPPHNLDPIYIVTPTTENARIEAISKRSCSCVYYACRKGTTGMKQALPNDYHTQIQRIKEHCDLPIMAGFGIADRKSAEAALNGADGFVVGSAFVKQIGKRADPTYLKAIAQLIAGI